MKNLLLSFIALFIFTGVRAQYSQLQALGDKEFKQKNYYNAAYYYKKADEVSKTGAGGVPFYSNGKISQAGAKYGRAYVYYQLAESYRLYQNYSDGEIWYNKILSENLETKFPLARLWYGVCLRANKNFEKAISELQQFNTGYKGDSKFNDIAKQEIANCLFAKQQYASHAVVKISKMEGPWLGGAGDYALIKQGGQYWFTSSRPGTGSENHLNNIYTASAQNPGKAVILTLKVNNSIRDIQFASPSIDGSGKRMYVTGWYKQGDNVMLAIYSSSLVNDKWAPLIKLNNNVNAVGVKALQPFVTPDGKHLFYASDKPGGQGGYDIWQSDLDNEGNPINSVNLGKTINTPLDEEAPYYNPVNKRLVYSSKGFVGLGGFDFFESYQDKGKWTAPNNLGYPVNSSKDDLYYFDDPDDRHLSYLSSDRESDCCLTLYQLQYPPLIIAGKISDCGTGKSAEGMNISLSDSSSKQTLKQVQTDANGSYTFEVEANHSYSLKVEKPGYFTKIVAITAKPVKDTIVIPDACLQPYKVNKPVVIKNILYDYDKATLRPESQIALDGVITLMVDNPKIKIEIGSHTDSIGNATYNLNLSQRRAQSCVDYIISKGIDKNRLSAKGYGKSIPVAPNSQPDGTDNPAGRQLNRRTEFTVINK